MTIPFQKGTRFGRCWLTPTIAILWARRNKGVAGSTEQVLGIFFTAWRRPLALTGMEKCLSSLGCKQVVAFFSNRNMQTWCCRRIIVRTQLITICEKQYLEVRNSRPQTMQICLSRPNAHTNYLTSKRALFAFPSLVEPKLRWHLLWVAKRSPIQRAQRCMPPALWHPLVGHVTPDPTVKIQMLA